MKPTSSSHTGIIVLVIVIVLAGVGYFYVQGGSAPSFAGLLTESVNTDVGLAEVNLLNQLKGIRIDNSLFTNGSYLSLQDYTIEIPDQPVGRANPFAPIPGVANPSATIELKK